MKPKKNINLFRFHKLLPDNIHLSYKGPFEKNILWGIGSIIENSMGETVMERKKIFSVFMEMAINVSQYSDENTILENNKKCGIGSIVVGEMSEYYYIITGNVVDKINSETIIAKCNTINSLEREGLRQLKREYQRKPRSIYGGSNIGLIQIALTTCNTLEYKTVPVNQDAVFLSIAVRINKNEIVPKEDLISGQLTVDS